MTSICEECDGTGERDWLSGARCYACFGSGLEPEPCPICFGEGGDKIFLDDNTYSWVACPACNGSGIERPHQVCRGSSRSINQKMGEGV